MLEELKRKMYEVNMELPRRGLIVYTWGNASDIDREEGSFAIKPGRVDYDMLKPSDMVVMGLEGSKVGGEMNPSSDTTTHVELYNRFKKIGGIIHTHPPRATAWTQAGRALPYYGITHTDYFYGEIPCVRSLTAEEIEKGYEKNMGKVIIETFQGKNLVYILAVLCKNHGPLTWDRDTAEAVHNAVALEEIARMNFMTELIDPRAGPVPQCIQDEYFMRKCGSSAYYGQGK